MSLKPAFLAHLATLDLESGRLLVAVSGGPDSVALLDLLVLCRDDARLDLTVAHVDHGIHPESGAVADRVRALAAHHRLPFLARALRLGASTSETRAREARYAALEEMRAEASAELIATAHHADDQAETVLMRTLAGTGPAGLAAMASRHGRVVRPLLPFRRDALARHLEDRGLAAWNDPANRDTRHLRSWVRQELLPLLEARDPEVTSRLCRVAEAASAERGAWDAVLQGWPGLDLRVEAGAVSLDSKALEAADPILARALVMAAARRCGLVLGPRRGARVLDALLHAPSGSWVPLGGSWRAEAAFGRLRLARAPDAAPPALPLTGQSGEAVWGRWRIAWRRAPAPPDQARTGSSAWFDPTDLGLRGWRAGDRVRPLGGPGRRLVVRCLQDARVPRSLRAGWPVIEHAGTIVWLPQVCRSDFLVPRAGADAVRIDAEPA